MADDDPIEKGASEEASSEKRTDSEKASSQQTRRHWPWDGQDYGRVILAEYEFIIFIDKAGDIDWTTLDDFDWKLIDLSRFNRIVNKVAEFEVLAARMPRDRQEQFKRLAAEALARALDKDLPAAESMLDYLSLQISERSRGWFLIICFCLVIPSLILSTILWIWRPYYCNLLGETVFLILLASASGVFGAILAVVLRSTEPKCAASAPMGLHILEAAGRLFGAAIGGAVVGLAIKSNWLLAPIGKGSTGDITVILAAFAAGYLERLTPSLIERLEGRLSRDDFGPNMRTEVQPKGGRRQAGPKTAVAQNTPPPQSEPASDG